MYLLAALIITIIYLIAKCIESGGRKISSIGDPEQHLKKMLSLDNPKERRKYLKSLK